MRVAVVGAGIAGLSAAWELQGSAEVVVFESGRTGGRILTEEFDGRPVEMGPDAFITRDGNALHLCAELQIDDLVQPSVSKSLIWCDGGLRPIPDGLILGVPASFKSLLGGGVLSARGSLRAASDLIRPRTVSRSGDVTVSELIARRFGSEVAERLVDPLVGGIHAGRAEDLSAEATLSQVLEVARQSRSLMLGLRRSKRLLGVGAAFMAPRSGLATLANRLEKKLRESGVDFRKETVTSVAKNGRSVKVDPAGEAFDAAILAVDSLTADRLLGPKAPVGLRKIDSVSVAVVVLSYGDVPVPAGAAGFLVPRGSGLLMTACSFGSAKWPHWARPGRCILRVSAGRSGDTRAMELDDESLVARIVEELHWILGWDLNPDAWRVARWPGSFAQYRVGHLDLMRCIEAQLSETIQGVVLCGSSYHGVGIPACIASGRRAARQIVIRHAAVSN